ncbi:hypothetical protein DOM21_14710 [Bacteriovorax stolpii]|uniref:Uncharacterized protein n=1 Tax=Bacteriovorax stolpii TaxID=960 RepID=A0A2K9NPA6_BACTC|nr:hypothetical protein [Bacteriovorax stolpii]AUN97351.1 hypothetical protein C0V70_04340 [Bacteriovorax stolpii]QDK42678.1 hypothetical protein DOM21_14710 [Bacteriovorax stolpii]TDP52523.1 hypothetical protein C8D79_2287 [Bacteriovorax stolpii]
MKKFKFYRSQILFIGLTTEEKYSIESALNKYSVYYQETFQQVEKITPYDLICLPEEEFLKNEKTLIDLKKPIITIGKKILPRTQGVLSRPIFISQCLELLQKTLPAVSRPSLEGLDVGSIVRSKTTPTFGKGIVISLLSEFEVLVRFPNSSLISNKDKAIRCHRAHLQILGNVQELT